MIDSVVTLVPQTTGAEYAGEAGKQAGSSNDSGFTDILGAVVRDALGTQGEQGDAAANKDAKADTQTISAVDASIIAAGIQMAFAQPVSPLTPVNTGEIQLNPTSQESQSPVDAVTGTKTDPLQTVAQDDKWWTAIGWPASSGSADVIGTKQDPIAQNVVQSQVQQVQTASDTINIQSGAVNADASALQSVFGIPNTQTTQNSVNPGAEVVASTQVKASNKTTSTNDVEVKTDASESNSEESVADAFVSETSKKQARGNTNVDTPITVETVPVEWRLDNNGRAVQTVANQVNAVADTVAAVGDAASKSTNNGNASASGDNANGAAVMAQNNIQFANAMQEATETQATAATSNIDHARIIDQVVREVKLHQFDGRSDLVIRLNPRELGAMRLQITQDASGITSQIHASSDQVRGLLQAHVPAMMDALANAGLKVDSVSVSLDSSFSGFAQNAMNGNAQGQQGQTDNTRQRFASGRGMSSGNGNISGIASSVQRTSEQAGYSWLV